MVETWNDEAVLLSLISFKQPLKHRVLESLHALFWLTRDLTYYAPWHRVLVLQQVRVFHSRTATKACGRSLALRLPPLKKFEGKGMSAGQKTLHLILAPCLIRRHCENRTLLGPWPAFNSTPRLQLNGFRPHISESLYNSKLPPAVICLFFKIRSKTRMRA